MYSTPKACRRGQNPEGFEAALIEHGFKWSPVKVYRKRFPRGIGGERWQLQFDVLYRAGEDPLDQPQEAFAIVTVKGFARNQPVYRDGVRAIR
jgi:serine protease AprX